jgi:restriction system protein
MAKDDQLPKFYELMNPLLQALRDLGGSGSIEELAAKVKSPPAKPGAYLVTASKAE